jgi:hypothetical protein
VFLYVQLSLLLAQLLLQIVKLCLVRLHLVLLVLKGELHLEKPNDVCDPLHHVTHAVRHL